MKAALALLLLASPAYACDWAVTESVDPMTDGKSCTISSASAKLTLHVYPEHIVFGSSSVYGQRGDSLQVRIDDNKAVVFGRSRSTFSSFAPDSEPARTAIEQIRTGERIRVSYLDYPASQAGEAAICNLPELIAACHAP